MNEVQVILAVLGLFTVGMALYAVIAKETAVAVLSAGAAGLFASVMFVVLAAPDVAITEAVIGSGLTTFIFFFVLKIIRKRDND